MERPFLHRKCSSVSSTSRPWPSVLQQPSFLSHYACSSRLGLGLIGNRFPASQPLSSLGSRGGLRLVYSDAWPQFTQCTLYGHIYSVSFVLVLRLLVHTTGSCLRSPLPLTLSELRWLGVGSSQSLRVARQMQQMPASHPTNGHTTAYGEASWRGPRRPRIVTRVLEQSECISMALSIFLFYLTVFTIGLRTGC